MNPSLSQKPTPLSHTLMSPSGLRSRCHDTQPTESHVHSSERAVQSSPSAAIRRSSPRFSSPHSLSSMCRWRSLNRRKALSLYRDAIRRRSPHRWSSRREGMGPCAARSSDSSRTDSPRTSCAGTATRQLCCSTSTPATIFGTRRHCSRSCRANPEPPRRILVPSGHTRTGACPGSA